MLKRTSVVVATNVAALVALGAMAWAAPGGGGGGPAPSAPPSPPTVAGTIPGSPGNPGDEDSPADGLGCPSGGEPWWHRATDEQVEAARSAGELTDSEDLANEALMGGANLWAFCNTNQGWRLWDYIEQAGTPAIRVEDRVDRPDPQLYPDNEDLVVGFPVWLTLENGGVQQLDIPPAAGQFRAVPEVVTWKTGVGDETVTCLDTRASPAVRRNLEPPSRPGAAPPSNACLYEYERPSTRVNSGGDGAFEFEIEVEYRIEWIPPGQTGWRLYTNPPYVQLATEPEAVRVSELQAVAD